MKYKACTGIFLFQSAETVKGIMSEILSQDLKNVCLKSFIAFCQIFMHHQNLHIVI